MKHLLFAPLLFALIASLAIATTAVAINPHFIGTPTITQSGETLEVKFKAAGLGNVDEATFNLSGTIDVFSRCYNRGGNKPQADNKQETIAVNATETFPARNGRTNGTFVVTATSTLECPGNQRVVIESFSYDLTLSGMGISHTFISP